MTREEYSARRPIRVNTIQINELKSMLTETDYKAIKYAEGLITEDDYSPIRSQRQGYRDEINRLEAENILHESALQSA